jgi:SAM-dependent methyltransferase
VRAFYEASWADAPGDPEPWAFARRRALLAREVLPGDHALDLGCGAGRFVRVLAELGADPVGIDIAEGAIERARRNLPGADLRLAAPDGTLPLDHGECDLVWCSETIEHALDVAHLLAEARRVLRPTGRLLLTTPDHGRLKRTAIALVRFEEHFDPLGEHLRFFSRASLAVALRRAGFGPPRFSTFGGPPLFRSSLVARAPRQA